MDRQAHIFSLQARSVGLCLDDFEADEWRFRPHGMGHALWILGHLLLERKVLGNILGMSEEVTARDENFVAGTDPDEVPADVAGAVLLAGFGALQFLLMHESFHVGQLGALRVMAGKGPFLQRMATPADPDA